MCTSLCKKCWLILHECWIIPPNFLSFFVQSFFSFKSQRREKFFFNDFFCNFFFLFILSGRTLINAKSYISLKQWIKLLLLHRRTKNRRIFCKFFFFACSGPKVDLFGRKEIWFLFLIFYLSFKSKKVEKKSFKFRFLCLILDKGFIRCGALFLVKKIFIKHSIVFKC